MAKILVKILPSVIVILSLGLAACDSVPLSKTQGNKQPRKTVKTVKAKPSKSLRDPSRISLQWPADGLILPQHKSVDIAGRSGTPIKAAGAGTVVYSGSGLKQYGNLVIIKHNEDFLTVYAHNRELVVKEGERVTKGQVVALMGKSGAERVKLHFEVRFKGKPQDPLKYLPKI